MDKHIENLEQWLTSLSDFSLPAYEDLPEMDLYMDQVISYLDRKLEPLATGSGDPQITPFMVNNYVKANLIAAPTLKKYSRVQLGYLFAICSVKQVLSMSDIKLLFETDKIVYPEKDKLYNFFRDVQARITHAVDKQVNAQYDVILHRYQEDAAKQDPKAFENFRANLSYIAFKLSIEAEINKIIADRIIYEVEKSTKDEKAEKDLAAAEAARIEIEHNKHKKKK